MDEDANCSTSSHPDWRLEVGTEEGRKILAVDETVLSLP